MSEQLGVRLNEYADLLKITGACIRQVTNNTEYRKIIYTPELAMDFRTKINPEDGYASVFDGLDFDPGNVRSHAFYIESAGEPIGVISFVIAPARWIEEQRYVINQQGTFILTNFNHVNGLDQTPPFLIIPGLAVVKTQYRTDFAIPGFRFFNQVMDEVQCNAPDGTFCEANARGKVDLEQTRFLLEYNVGQEIDPSLLPMNELGVNYPGSSSSVKMAKLLGLTQIENVGSARTLGPVFVKKVA